MAELWFYRPHGVIGKTVAWVTQGDFAHVSIMHSVADISVVTEAHPIKGVWCSPVSRVRKPDVRIFVDVDDAWTTRWLVNKWGVQYGWIDALAFTVPSYRKEADRRGVICSELVGLFVLDAAADVVAAKSAIPTTWVSKLTDGPPLARVSPSLLHKVFTLAA